VAHRVRGLGVALVLAGLLPAVAAAVDGNVVLESAKLAPPSVVGAADYFGSAIALLGDLNGAGGPDLAVGADLDGNSVGSVSILFLDTQGAVVSATKTNGTAPFGGGRFGHALASLGDMDGDGNPELAIGAPEASDGSIGTGVVWIAELDRTTGAVVGTPLRISNGTSGFPAAQLEHADQLGSALAAADLNDDGRPELIVGTRWDDDGASATGAIYILYLNANGTVAQATKVSDTAGGLDGAALSADIQFGTAIAAIDDQDGDGQTDLAVGAPITGTGRIFLLFLTSACGAPAPNACAVKAGAAGYRLIAHGVGGFPIQDAAPVTFGTSLAWLPASSSLANDRLAVGDSQFGPQARGAVWLFEAVEGLLLAPKRIASSENWGIALDELDKLGFGVGSLGDLNGDSATDLAIGAIDDDDAGSSAGAVYLAYLSPCATIISRPKIFHDPTDVGRDPCVTVQLPASPVLHLYIQSGGDVSGNPANACTGAPAAGDEMCAWDVRISVEAPLYVQGFTPALSGLYTSNPSQTPHELRVNWIGPSAPQNGAIKIGDVTLGNVGPGGEVAVAAGSGAVGADLQLQTIGERTLGLPEPAVFLSLFAGGAVLAGLARRRRRSTALGLALTLWIGLTVSEPARAATSISGQVRITPGQAGFNPPAYGGEGFIGSALAPLGDLDADGTLDLAVSAAAYCCTYPIQRVFTMFLAEQGTVLGFEDELRSSAPNQDFGSGMALLPDRDGNGVQDLLIGARAQDENPPSQDHTGQVSIVFLNRAGFEVAPRVVIRNGLGGLPAGTLEPQRYFGSAVASLGDVDGDGTFEIAVGASHSYGGNPVQGGEVWLLSLNAANQVVAYREITLPSIGEPNSYDIHFGDSLASVGDLDGDGYGDLAVGAPGQVPVSVQTGALYVLFLEPHPVSGVQVKSKRRISPGESGLALGVGVGSLELGRSLAWMGPLAGGGGVLAVGLSSRPDSPSAGAVYMLRVKSDGTVGGAYRIAYNEPVGAVISATTDTLFGHSLAAPGDLDGDEIPDLAVGAPFASPGSVFLFFLKDADHDGLDDVLDNCPNVHNPQQADADGDKVGDLCDNCPALANTPQADVDSDGEGDSCEPVEMQLTTTGTPSSPSWNLSVECGAYTVTRVNAAIVMPAGSTNPKTLTLNGASIGGGSGTSGPGLVSPAGVRSDAIYFSALGNGSGGRLCTALDPPTLLGTLTTGAIGGTQLAAAALTSEGVGVPGFGLALARDAAGNIPLADVRLVNGEPLPILRLELGPAVTTSGGTRWDVIAKNASAEFHRVTFGLIAPNGTTTSQMRWVGCNTAPNGSGVRSCTGGTGFGTTTSASNSFTQGPIATPPGTQLPHTLYVSLVGNRPSQSSQLTFNPVNGPTQVTLGTVELDASPDLEPALTVDGVESVTANPLQKADSGVPSPTQLRLIGAFNPADDVDGDEVQDLSDDCPFAFDSAQQNRGSFLDDTDDSDALGDACQCGESTGDGAVLSPDDFNTIRLYLTGLITNPVIAAEIAARCSVEGTTDCNIRDLVLLKLAMDAGDPSVATKCDAALSPAAP